MTAREERVKELQVLGLDDEEAEAVLPSQAAPRRVSQARICTDYLNTTHPETGLDVVFVPGEALPEWAYADQQARRVAPEGDTLPIAPRKPLRALDADRKTADGK